MLLCSVLKLLLGKKTQSMTFSTEHRADLMTEVLVSSLIQLLKILKYSSAVTMLSIAISHGQ